MFHLLRKSRVNRSVRLYQGGSLLGAHIVQNASKGVNVTLHAVILSVNDLRRHVAIRADMGPSLLHGVLKSPRLPKIPDLDQIVLAQEDVLRLNISMQNIFLAHVIECLDNRHKDVPNSLLRQGVPVALCLEIGCQVAIFTVFHEDVQFVVCFKISEVFHNIRMLQVSHDLRFSVTLFSLLRCHICPIVELENVILPVKPGLYMVNLNK